MATKRGISPVLLMLFVLIAVIVSFAIIASLQSSVAAKTQKATESATFKQARQAYLIQTRDLPDLKLEAFQNTGAGAPECNVLISLGGVGSSGTVIKLTTKAVNLGNGDASGPDEDGITMCGEDTVFTVELVTGALKRQNIEDFKFKQEPALESLPASARSGRQFIYRTLGTICPRIFEFTPKIDCADEIEELNEDNNALPRKLCNPNPNCNTGDRCRYTCQDISGSTSGI